MYLCYKDLLIEGYVYNTAYLRLYYCKKAVIFDCHQSIKQMAGQHRTAESSIVLPKHRRLSLYQPTQTSGFTIIEQSRQGVKTQQVDQLAELLSISLKEMAAILQIAERTLHRLRREGQLDSQSSERLLLLDNLAAHGLLVFDGRTNALADWLRQSLRELKHQTPLQLLTTISGFGLVDDVLTRIEYGVYS